jgi:hypothetical protein
VAEEFPFCTKKPDSVVAFLCQKFLQPTTSICRSSKSLMRMYLIGKGTVFLAHKVLIYEKCILKIKMGTNNEKNNGGRGNDSFMNA